MTFGQPGGGMKKHQLSYLSGATPAPKPEVIVVPGQKVMSTAEVVITNTGKTAPPKKKSRPFHGNMLVIRVKNSSLRRAIGLAP